MKQITKYYIKNIAKKPTIPRKQSSVRENRAGFQVLAYFIRIPEILPFGRRHCCTGVGG